MARPVFRDKERLPILEYREYFRNHFPEGSQGLVVEDVDLLVRSWGRNFHTDSTGQFMLLEVKFGRAWPGFAQLKTFGLLDSLLRQADPERARYKGFYILQHSHDSWEESTFRLNGNLISREDLDDFLQFKSDKTPYQFPLAP